MKLRDYKAIQDQIASYERFITAFEKRGQTERASYYRAKLVRYKKVSMVK